MVAPLISVRHICKRYGQVEALSGVGFSIYAGEVLGLIGPNGSGKTTLLECLCGLVPADRREVWWQQCQVAPQRSIASIFYVPEAAVPYPEHTVRRVLAFFGGAFRVSPHAMTHVVDLLALGPVLQRRAGQLSKGWRRRLLVAVGLLAPQPVLVMDEPFDGLDLRQTREMMTVLRGAASQGRTLVLSIHQLTDAERVCDRFVLLSGGKVAGEGTLTALRERLGNQQATLEDAFLALS
jgi:ABC-2 type transport system ATP-binding protein